MSESSIDFSQGLGPAIGTAGVLLVAGLYKAFRMIKNDFREDRANQTTDDYRDHIFSRVKDLEEICEKRQSDLNDCLISRSQLEATVASNNLLIAKLTRSNISLRSQVRTLIGLIGEGSDKSTIDAIENLLLAEEFENDK